MAQAYSVLQYLYIGKALITKYKDVKEWYKKKSLWQNWKYKTNNNNSNKNKIIFKNKVCAKCVEVNECVGMFFALCKDQLSL